MPVPAGRSNAGIIMLAEKAADLILDRPAPAPEAMASRVHPDRENAQR